MNHFLASIIYNYVNFTFGICTDHKNKDRILLAINSIINLNIKNYEIIVIGGTESSYFNHPNVIFVNFDENIKPIWITKKKNDIAKMAKYENLCLMHDYFTFNSDWYEGYLKFDKEFGYWDVASNPQIMLDGRRHLLDWTGRDKNTGERFYPEYLDWSRINEQYISGGFFLVKTQVILDNLLDENRGWDQDEDVEWSNRIKNKYVIRCNPYSSVRLTKESRSKNMINRYLEKLK